MSETQPDKTNAALDAALTALGKLDNAVDLRWLSEELRAWNIDGYRAKLHGIPGGHADYARPRALTAAYDAAAVLSPADRRTLAIMVDMLYRLMSPQPDEARGMVQLKTIVKHFPVIDWAATGDGNLVYAQDDNGDVITEPHSYTYAYIRQYAGKGNADRKGARLLSLYADRGMGKGGSGGYVAAAYSAELVTQDDILNAWHEGKDTYQAFIDHCAELLHSAGLGPVEADGNSDETEAEQ